MNQIICRQAVPSDAESIRDFQLAMAMETEGLKLDGPTVDLGVRAVFKDSSKGRYYVLEKSGKILGSMLVIQEWSDWRSKYIWWIHSVYIIPGERGHGYFSKLYRHIQEMAKASDQIAGLRLYVEKKNTSAQAVYEKLGMTNEHYFLYEWLKSY